MATRSIPQHLLKIKLLSHNPMKKILILGVNGFIGHHLSKRIIAKTD